MSTTMKTNTSSSENRYKKKSTPEGAPISEQDYGTTPKGKSHAEMMFARIRTGKENAMMTDRRSDRAFRALVARANKEGDCIINNGYGYFRPGPDDAEEVKHYILAELHRAKEIEDKADAIREAYFGRY